MRIQGQFWAKKTAKNSTSNTRQWKQKSIIGQNLYLWWQFMERFKLEALFSRNAIQSSDCQFTLLDFSLRLFTRFDSQMEEKCQAISTLFTRKNAGTCIGAGGVMAVSRLFRKRERIRGILAGAGYQIGKVLV